MRAALCFFFLAACAAVPAVPMSASGEAREVLAPTGSLRVALDPDPTGISEALARELARRLRVPIVFVPGGEADVAFVQAQRDQRLDFSPPYFESYAIGIEKNRSRALPYLRDFVDDAVQRGVVREAIQREGSRGRM